MLLHCAVQQYAWGKVGKASEVASLAAGGNSNFNLKDDSPYAELWMGTHSKGPSVVAATGQPLADWIQQNPESVGKKVSEKFPATGQLPFLFKVLSVNVSLSIQAHPNKSHAEHLHSTDPSHYPDANHKPEMAIALTPFEGLCGFRPTKEIVGFLNNVPELGAVIGRSLVEELEQAANEVAEKGALQKCFKSLMTCDPEIVKDKLNTLVNRLAASADSSSNDGDAELLLRLNSQFPGDGGCFCIYFLNHMRLQPGDAMFLEANLPHAYLSGDCIECMACSDNVVRAGLTPKFKDVDVLCEMLTYAGRTPSANIFPSSSHPSLPHVTIYDPPVPDFTVARIQIPEGVNQHVVTAEDSGSLLLVVQGEATGTATSSSMNVQRGCVLFLAAQEELKLSVTSSGMLMFRAYCKLD